MPGETYRCFIALPLPNRVKFRLKEVQQIFKAQKAVHAGFVNPKGFHLTLNFIGDCSTGTLENLKPTIAKAVSSLDGFHLKTSGLGVFPEGTKVPRILWTGIGGDISSLLAVRNQIRTQLPNLGLAKGKQAFIPHITLARFKGKPNSGLVADLIQGAGMENLKTGFHVDNIHLYKSELQPSGAVHTLVHSWMLKGKTGFIKNPDPG